METTVAKVTQQHLDARKDAILTAAARLFARKGVAGATMQEIAKDAELSAGAIYRYYSNKEELLRAVFDDAQVRNQQLFEGAALDGETPMDALVQVGRRVWFAHDDRDALICEVQMTLSAARDPDDFGLDLFQARNNVLTMLEQMVRRAQEAGQLDPRINAEHLAIILQACTSGFQMIKLDRQDGDLDIEAVFNLMVKMVASLAPEPSPTLTV